MNSAEIQQVLDTLTLIVDTREQDTPLFRKRMKQVEIPYIRRKLDYGDYGAKVIDVDGSEIDLSSQFVVERKMSIDELAQNMTRSRSRFIREFERAAAAGAKTYLLVENASWEKAYSGEYRTQVNPNALTASMIAWLARYNCQLIMCKKETTPKLLHDICYREAKEYLTKIVNDEI